MTKQKDSRHRSLYTVLFVLLLYGVLYSRDALGQRTFSLEPRNLYRNSARIVNPIGAQLYILLNDSMLFVPKVGEYDYRTNYEIDSLIARDTLKKLYFIIRTKGYDYKIPAVNYTTNFDYGIILFKEGKRLFYSIHLGTYGKSATTENVEVIQNGIWQDRYIVSPK